MRSPEDGCYSSRVICLCPKSVRNRCVIKVLVAFLCCHVAFLDFSVGVGASVIGLNHISTFCSC